MKKKEEEGWGNAGNKSQEDKEFENVHCSQETCIIFQPAVLFAKSEKPFREIASFFE